MKELKGSGYEVLVAGWKIQVQDSGNSITVIAKHLATHTPHLVPSNILSPQTANRKPHTLFIRPKIIVIKRYNSRYKFTACNILFC
jgi:hypothetical protein